MKVLLFLCTTFSVLDINLSLRTRTIDYNVGTIGLSGQPYPHRYYIYCEGPYCVIEEVVVALSTGEMNLTGLYTNSYGRVATFCEGQPKNVTTGIKECTLLRMFWLREAQIKIDALEVCHSVMITVRARNMYGIKIEPRQPLKEIQYNVGTLGELGTTYHSLYYIYCKGPCDIAHVKAKLRDGDDLRLTGFYGRGVIIKFCEELPNDWTGIEKCGMLKKHWLPRARIKFDFDQIIRNVILIVDGYNLYKISPDPPSQYEFVKNVGTLEKDHKHSYWIYCNGPCELEEILVDKEDHRNRYLQLEGYYGNDYETNFCQDVVQVLGLEKCIIKEDTWHPTALFNLVALRKQYGVRIKFRGYNVIKIVEDKPPIITITKDVGIIEKHQYMQFDLTCTGAGGSCALHLIEATFRGDVRISGPHSNWIFMKNPNVFIGSASSKCPSRSVKASVILFGFTRSGEVTFTVKGPYLESVDFVREWSFSH